MKKVAVIIDAGYLSKVFFHICNKEIQIEQIPKLSLKLMKSDEELFRAYYYDCPPFKEKRTNPISKIEIDYSDTHVAQAKETFQLKLSSMDYIAFRRGELKAFGWKLTKSALKQIEGGKQIDKLEAKHLEPNFSQKGVDVRIGLDIANLANKKIVDKAIMITGDTDFIPAMKYARKEGLLISVVDFGKFIHTSLRDHADQIIKFDLKSI